ncbi:MAG TPA: AMP-binding protein [Methylomirabilota bacterium]|nr:AMP-binding protein [Methylomirabilota bacterium]
MLDLREYNSLGGALRAALARWPDETCLIESDRDRAPKQMTFRQFGDAAPPLAAALQDAGFAAADRASIIMTNQSKWLISAYAIFFSGGVLVPLDYKLTAEEHLQLLAHSKAKVLITEFALWRAITQAAIFSQRQLPLVLVTEAPPGADLAGARRWEDFRSAREPEFRERQRDDPACIVYSSGTGGRPKGCVLTHECYLEQCMALTSLYPFWPGVRYLSILPTNHAVDFMVGFIGPFTCGACVVHLRTLRPEFVREAFPRFKITYMTLVPAVLKNLERGLRARFADLPKVKRAILKGLIAMNRLLVGRGTNLAISRRLLRQVHESFGGELRALFVGGAFTEPATLEFFQSLGIPVSNAYGLTEACTVVAINNFKPFRSDTVGRPLPGIEVRIDQSDADGIGEVAVRGKTIMSGYLDDPELTAATIVDGWLFTGDLGRLDASGHLQLFGRKKNMIVTAEGKNIYPEDVENVFEGIGVKEFCVFAANYLWPQRTMVGEQLVMVLHPEPGQRISETTLTQLAERNLLLINYKRVSGYLVHDRDFPRTTALKIKRVALAEEIQQSYDRGRVVPL